MKLNFLTVVISLLWFKPAHGDLDSFVTEKLLSFPGWLLANNLDPFPYKLLNSNFSASSNGLDISSIIGSVIFPNISVNPDIYVSYGALEEERGWFFLHTPFPNNIFASGWHETTFSTDGINQKVTGGWYTTFKRRIDSYGYRYGIEFNILPSGHLEIVNLDHYSDLGYWYPSDTYFDGLSDNDNLVEHKKGLKSMLQSNLAVAFGDIDAHLATKVIGRFWDEVFSDVTVQDIIDHDGPPATTRMPIGSSSGKKAEQKAQEMYEKFKRQSKNCNRKSFR